MNSLKNSRNTHQRTEIADHCALNILAIPAFTDNYLWLITHQQSAWAVDPGCAKSLQHALEQYDLQLRGILLTHHHADHVGGVSALCQHAAAAHQELPVYGPASPLMPMVTHSVQDTDFIELDGLPCTMKVLTTPGHTLEHVAYFLAGQAQSPPALFCGDTLFAGGCGRIFTGTAQQLYHSLQKISELPLDTHIYCAHEYTSNNLRFAMQVEPHNSHLQQRIERVAQLRAQDKPTIPSTLAEELATNPFLRVNHVEVVQAICQHMNTQITNPEALFSALRAWKDTA